MTALSRKETIAAIEPIKPAIEPRSPIPELGHVWFDGEFAYATNNGIGIKSKFNSPLKCGVPGQLFFGLLSRTAGESLEFKQQGNGLKFKAGRSSISLATLPFTQLPWRYPATPSKKPVATFKITEEFLKSLKRVSALKPSPKKRMEHYSVCIFAEGNEMDLYVTDSKSLLVMGVAEKINGAAKKIALPREMADVIASQCKPDRELRMYSDHFFIQANDNVAVFGNIFDTSEMLDMPSVADAFTDRKKYPPVAMPEDLNAALERAIVLAGSELPVVTLKSEGKAIKLAAKFRYGEINEEFTLDKAPFATQLNVDAKTLLAVENATKIAFSERALTLSGDDGFTYILTKMDLPAGREGPGEGSGEEEDGEPERRPTRSRKPSQRARGAEETTDDDGDELNDNIDDVPFEGGSNRRRNNDDEEGTSRRRASR